VDSDARMKKKQTQVMYKETEKISYLKKGKAFQVVMDKAEEARTG